jgi:uncharacterized protein YkwD
MRIAGLVLAVLACVLAPAGVADARQADGHAGACASANAATPNPERVARAVLCIENGIRRARGLSSLRWNPALAGVATAHARDMVRRRYFSHFSPGHMDQLDRIARSSYRPARGCWTAGENLLEAAGLASPERMMEAWMHSPLHRAVILHRGWRDFGLGVVHGTPSGNRHGLTLVALFGVRTGRPCR